MARFEKYKSNQCKFLVGHSKHKYRPRDDHVDPVLTPLNTEYIARDMEFLQSRLAALKCSPRADVNVLAELIVTLPKEFRGSSEDFFDCIFKFACLNYKEQNIVYAVVHRDEPNSQEHIHVGFVPTVYDSKKKVAKVSYDMCVHRKLDKFHDKLSEYCEKTFGYDVGILNGSTADGNKSIAQLKAETEAREQAERLRAQNEQLKREQEQLLLEQEQLLSLPDKLIVAKYKAENEQLKKQNHTYAEFIKQNRLLQAFRDWFAMVTGKVFGNSAQKDKEKY